MMKPRRALSADEPDPFVSDESEFTLTKRGLPPITDDTPDPRRASRAAAPVEADDAEPVSTGSTPARPSRAAVEAAEDGESEYEPVAATESLAEQRESDEPAESQPAPPAEPQPVAEASASPKEKRKWAGRIAEVAGTVVLAVAAIVGASYLPAQSVPEAASVPIVTATARICPAASDATVQLMAGTTSGGIEARNLEGGVESLSSPLARDINAPIILRASEPTSELAGGVRLRRGTQEWWGECRTPKPDEFLLAPGAVGTDLVIVNSDTAEALVDVTLTTPEGEVSADELRGIKVQPNVPYSVKLDRFTPNKDAIGVRVRSSMGRVTSTLRVDHAEGGDFVTGSAPGRVAVIPAISGANGGVRLLVSNPSTTRQTVQLRVLGAAGAYAIPEQPTLTLDARRTQVFDLPSLTKDDTAIELTADQEIGAAAVLTVAKDFAVVPAVSESRALNATQQMAVIPESGRLQLLNRATTPATVTIDWGAGQALAQRTIPAESVVFVDSPAGATQALVSAESPILGAIYSRSDTTGVSVVTLRPTNQRTSMPLQLDPKMK